MADFKFSCPGCGQHIACDAGYSGMQINCPNCKQAIIVPQSPTTAAASMPPRIATPPPLPPSAPGLATRQSTAAPSTGQRFMGAPGMQPPPKPKSKVLKNILMVVAALVGAAIGFLGVQFALGNLHLHGGKSKANPAAQVAAPSANSTMQALGILAKVYAAYTNETSVKANGTFTAFLDVSNITMGDVNPNAPANMRDRRPPGMPRIITNTTVMTFKRLHTNFFYVAGDAISKVDRQTFSNTFAFWKSDKGQFSFMDMHLRGMSPMYHQLPENDATQAAQEQSKKVAQLFADPANLNKLVKDLGQTADEPVNGQDCYTLTAKVLGQKVKVWVDKNTYLIPQWQLTLGGEISDADIDDLFSLYTDAITNMPPMQLNIIKEQFKKFAPVIIKIRGTLAFTAENIEVNPTLTADDFNYDVPPGIRLVPMAAAATPANAAAARQRNTCINNLRQIDSAKQQWALENGKKTGDTVTMADIKPFLGRGAGGEIPKCPAGGTYTIGKIGETPTCSIPGHALLQ